MPEYLVFQAGQQAIGAAVEYVREVVRAATLSSPAGQSNTIEGILNLRGNAVPVVALSELFDIRVPPMSAADYLVVMSDSQNRYCAVRSTNEVKLTSEAELVESGGEAKSAYSRVQQLRIGRLILPLVNPEMLQDFADYSTLSTNELSRNSPEGNE